LSQIDISAVLAEDEIEPGIALLAIRRIAQLSGAKIS